MVFGKKEVDQFFRTLSNYFYWSYNNNYNFNGEFTQYTIINGLNLYLC